MFFRRHGPKDIYLHIGMHRTGSTAIQSFLSANRKALAHRGFAIYRGRFERDNHSELYLAAMRPERDSLAKLKWNLVVDDRFIGKVAKRVRRFLASTRRERVIFTCEGLSLLRFPDEMEMLKRILGDDHRFHVILYLREKRSFLKSYRRQLLKMPGREPTGNKASVLYCEPDSWLVDFDGLTRAWSEAFEDVKIIDYDGTDVIPTFVQALGLSPDGLSIPGNRGINH